MVGDGEQTRDFTFVTDIATAFLAAANSNVTDEVMNVGSGGTYSITRLVQLLGGEVVHLPKRPGEPDSTFADTTRIRKLLGWKPVVDFESAWEKCWPSLTIGGCSALGPSVHRECDQGLVQISGRQVALPH